MSLWRVCDRIQCSSTVHVRQTIFGWCRGPLRRETLSTEALYMSKPILSKGNAVDILRSLHTPAPSNGAYNAALECRRSLALLSSDWQSRSAALSVEHAVSVLQTIKTKKKTNRTFSFNIEQLRRPCSSRRVWHCGSTGLAAYGAQLSRAALGSASAVRDRI